MADLANDTTTTPAVEEVQPEVAAEVKPEVEAKPEVKPVAEVKPVVEVETFEATASGAEKTYPIRAGEVKKGMTVLLKGKPCKVIEVTTSKTGKHGHAKANITGLDIFTGKKYQDISPCSHNMVAPFVTTTTYTLTDVVDGFCTLMTDGGEMREDLECPDENSPDKTLGPKIMEALENEDDNELFAVVTKAMDDEKVTSVRVGIET